MLINLIELCYKYQLLIKGIIHIGAHELEEIDVYKFLEIQNIIWIEANEEIVKNINSTHPNEIVFPFAICDEDDEIKEFIVTNNYASSSLLELKTHKIEHPHVFEIERIKVKTKRLDTLVKEESIDLSYFNFLNIDIQGAELLALKGAKDTLKYIDYIYLEVNEKELYEGCALLPEIDDFLEKNNFERVELKMLSHGWGDAFYIKNKNNV